MTHPPTVDSSLSCLHKHSFLQHEVHLPQRNEALPHHGNVLRLRILTLGKWRTLCPPRSIFSACRHSSVHRQKLAAGRQTTKPRQHSQPREQPLFYHPPPPPPTQSGYGARVCRLRHVEDEIKHEAHASPSSHTHHAADVKSSTVPVVLFGV